MITYRDFTLSFQLRSDTSAMTAQAVVQEAQRAESEAPVNASAGKTVSQKSAVELPNQAASVSYKNILPSVDIQYQISGKRLKEYLVFDAPPTQLSFSYDLTYTGLEPAVPGIRRRPFLCTGRRYGISGFHYCRALYV